MQFCSTSDLPMQKRITIKPKMKRKQVSLVFAILLLIATLPSHSTASVAIDAESAELDLKIAPARKSLVATKHMLATRLKSRKLVAVKNVHKVPSGPNPIGNQQLPPFTHS
ncbi:hypothetical protein ABKV19_023960 [Rosa sericea]